jgi:hypothetical protein
MPALNMDNITKGLSQFALLFLVIIVVGLFVFIIFKTTNKRKIWKIKIHCFEEINNQFVPTDDDIAMEVTIPNTSIKVFYLKKRKIYLPRGIRQMGKNHYWYGIRRNREWVNFSLTNLNKEMKELNIDYDHTDMLNMNTFLKKLIERNYKKTKWWQEYKNEIAVAILVILVGIMVFLWLGKINEITATQTAVLNSVKEVQELNIKVLNALDRVCSGSGVTSAG